MTLSDTQRVILSQASQRDDFLAIPPDRLPGAARQKVAAALIRQGFVSAEDASTNVGPEAWQIDGQTRLLRITDAGLRAIGIEPDAPEQDDAEDDRPRHERNGIDEALIYGPAEEFEQPATMPAAVEKTPRGLKAAAEQFLAAWDACPAQDTTDNPISRAVEAIRAALASKPARTPRDPNAPRKSREGTKQEAVLAMLRRPEGATIAQIAESTGWAQHTVRGFFAGMKRRQGIEVQVLERVRENKEGGRGSYSVYHLPG